MTEEIDEHGHVVTDRSLPSLIEGLTTVEPRRMPDPQPESEA